MHTYEVKGVGIKTGRPRKRKYKGCSEEEVIEKAKQDGTKVLEIKKLPPDPPTERQIEYALDLGIRIPPDANKYDLSNLIDLYLSYDKYADERILGFAKKFGVLRCKEWKYIGKKKLFDEMWDYFISKEKHRDMVAWFAYRIYRGIVHGRYDVEIQDPWHPIIMRIAEKYKDDEVIIKSLKRNYRGKDLIWFGEIEMEGEIYYGGSKHTIAYKTIYSELMRALALDKISIEKFKELKELYGFNQVKVMASIIVFIILILIVMMYYH